MSRRGVLLVLFVPTFFSFNILFVPLSSADMVYSDAVHISEFIPNPTGSDSEFEFIELYNDSGTEVDLSGWVIDTGGSARFTIDDGTILAAESFLTYYSADKNISLTNTGDHIQFIRPDSVVQDDITYTSSIEGHSYIRKDDGRYEDSDTPTPNAGNGVVVTPTPSPSVTPTPTASAEPALYSSDIHVSEFLPNPEGDDGELEFVELHNGSSSSVDISGWIIDTGSTSRFTISAGTSIPAGGFLALFSSSNDISLSNSSDRIQLLRPDSSIQDDILYSSSKEGYSYNRSDIGAYEQSFTPTPNTANVITVSPTPAPKTTSSATPKPEEELAVYDFSSRIVINELLPNPKGSDEENEYIEIKNLDKKDIRLEGWTLDDSAKGTAFRFPKTATINPGKILVFYRNVTKIALNNDTDTIKLLDPKGKAISTVTYEKPVVEGEGWNRVNDGSYSWSAAVTPGQENTIIVHEQLTPSPKTTKKPSAPSKKSSGPITATTPSVLGARVEMLAWPEPISSTRTVINSPTPLLTGRQHLFVLIGGTVAFAQLMAGISRKEAIWRR